MLTPPPTVLAFIVADTVLRDAATRKHYILGTLDTIHSPTFPAVVPGFTLYLAITAVHGTVALDVRIVDIDELRPEVFRAELRVPFPSPVTVGEVAWPLPGALTFPAPGECRVQVLHEGALLAERQLRLAKMAGAKG